MRTVNTRAKINSSRVRFLVEWVIEPDVGEEEVFGPFWWLKPGRPAHSYSRLYWLSFILMEKPRQIKCCVLSLYVRSYGHLNAEISTKTGRNMFKFFFLLVRKKHLDDIFVEVRNVRFSTINKIKKIEKNLGLYQEKQLKGHYLTPSYCYY